MNLQYPNKFRIIRADEYRDIHDEGLFYAVHPNTSDHTIRLLYNMISDMLERMYNRQILTFAGAQVTESIGHQIENIDVNERDRLYVNHINPIMRLEGSDSVAIWGNRVKLKDNELLQYFPKPMNMTDITIILSVLKSYFLNGEEKISNMASTLSDLEELHLIKDVNISVRFHNQRSNEVSVKYRKYRETSMRVSESYDIPLDFDLYNHLLKIFVRESGINEMIKIDNVDEFITEKDLMI